MMYAAVPLSGGGEVGGAVQLGVYDYGALGLGVAGLGRLCVVAQGGLQRKGSLDRVAGSRRGRAGQGVL